MFKSGKIALSGVNTKKLICISRVGVSEWHLYIFESHHQHHIRDKGRQSEELTPWPHSRNETQQVISEKQTDMTARRGPTTRDLMTPWLILFCLATLINYQRQIINEKMCIF